ncbi:hypothetical protein [Paraburkholderia fungorum]|uniref:hypothetical protein n=1 Tax=Paraburkholderia fungorum TaxID=134537 RepID=UPI00142E6729|nr:hypothetical protein [Paraburkholderia fungorum]
MSKIAGARAPRVRLDGRKFNRLTVVEWAGNGKWLCLCDCGSTSSVQGYKLKTGDVKSCGCLNDEKRRECNTRHGLSDTRIHRSWMSMRQRCENPKDRAYHRYGGRGIKVCDRWQIFENFASDMGPMPEGKTLDRFPNVNGNYEPGNCRWADDKQQARNLRSNRVITHNGKTQCLSAWAEECGINRVTIAHRLRKGMSFEQAITQPVSDCRDPVAVANRLAARWAGSKQSSADSAKVAQ